MADKPAVSESGIDPKIYRELTAGAIKYRNYNDRLKRWQDYDRISSYNFNGKGSGGDSPVVNIMASRARSIAPQLGFNNPTFNVTYISGQPNPNSAQAAGIGLETLWRDERVNRVLSRGLFDWARIGRGIYFVGFEAANEGDVLDAKQAVAGAMDNMKSQKAEQGRIASIIAKTRDLVGMGDKNKPVDPPSEMTSFKMMLDQRVYSERISPFNFIIDPCAESQDDAAFMGRRIFLPKPRAELMFPKATIKAESIGNASVYTDVGTGDPFGGNEVQDPVSLPESVKRVEVWEIWHIINRETVYLDNRGQILGAFPWKSPYPGFPFVLLDWDEVPDCPYPEGICASMHTLNNELNEIRRRELAEAGKAFNIMLGPKGIDPATKKKITEAKDGAFVEVTPEEFDSIKILERAMMPSDFWTLENRIISNLDEASRTTAMGAGGVAAKRMSATEASNSQSSMDAAMGDRQQQVEFAASQIAERMITALFATCDTPITLNIVDQDQDSPTFGEQIPYPWTPSEHVGFVKVEVQSGSMASVAKDVERQQASMVWQMLAPEPFFDKQAFALHYLSMFPSIKDPSKFIIDVPEAPPEPPAEAGMDAQQQPMEGDPMMMGGLPPEMSGGMMPPMQPDLGIGSGMPQVDLMAAVQGGAGPMTGPNGLGGMPMPPLQ